MTIQHPPIAPSARAVETSRSDAFSLRRRRPEGGTTPLTQWGLRNETDRLTDVLLGSPAFLRHLAEPAGEEVPPLA